MPLTLDINLWAQKWHKIDPSQQRDFLLMQLDRSADISFKDIPLIMMSLITEHHLKALALNASAVRAGCAQNASSLMADGSCVASPVTATTINYALHNKQYSFVTPDFVLKEVWEIMKPTPNVATPVGTREREQRLPADYNNRRQSLGTATALNTSGYGTSLNASTINGGGSPINNPLGGLGMGGGNTTNTRIEFQRVEDEYYDEEEKRAALRREALQAVKDLSPTLPNALACDIMDGWTVGPHQLESRRQKVLKAEEALIEVATQVICGIKGIDPDADADVEEYNPYAKAKPSVPKAVRWLAKRLLHSILGYDVLVERHERLILENFDAQWNAVTPLASILDLLWVNWDQRRVPSDIHSRAVIEECRHASFNAALSWDCKECMIVSACANFTFVLFALWVSPKWNLAETLPQSLMAAKVFFQRRKVTNTGLLIDYLNVKSVYEDVEGEIARQVAEPAPFIRMLIRSIAKVADVRLPELQRTLELWSAGALDLSEEEVGGGATPSEKLLIAATRSWFESLFTAPTPHNNHYDAGPNESPMRGGRDGGMMGRNGRPTSSQMLARIQANEQYGAEENLMTEADCSLFWRHFVAFGWPFVAKLGLQVLQESTSAVPLLIHSRSPVDLSAYATAGGAGGTSGLSIYNNAGSGALAPLVTDPKLEALLRKVVLPPDYRPITLLEGFLDGPPYDYIDLNDLRVMQKAFLVAVNRLPSCVKDLHGVIRRIEQWDQALYEAMREETDPMLVDLLRKWDSLFISSHHAKKKTRSILQAIGAEVDAMERILPMAQPSRY